TECAKLVKKRDSRQEQTSKPLVGASGLDVAGLLALVADTVVADLGRAVARKVTDLTAWWLSGRQTVVALLALGAVARHVAETTARVAGLAAGSAVALALVATLLLLEAAALGAVAGNVADLAAL
ncbi:unnamed protein product, partial [Aureobasidium pullulans]